MPATPCDMPSRKPDHTPRATPGALYTLVSAFTPVKTGRLRPSLDDASRRRFRRNGADRYPVGLPS